MEEGLVKILADMPTNKTLDFLQGILPGVDNILVDKSVNVFEQAHQLWIYFRFCRHKNSGLLLLLLLLLFF